MLSYVVSLEYQQRVSLWVEPVACKVEIMEIKREDSESIKSYTNRFRSYTLVIRARRCSEERVPFVQLKLARGAKLPRWTSNHWLISRMKSGRIVESTTKPLRSHNHTTLASLCKDIKTDRQ